MDGDLQSIQRRVKAAPDDLGERLRSLNARSRLEGRSVYLELLRERVEWNTLDEGVQDVVIDSVGSYLGNAYEKMETQTWVSRCAAKDSMPDFTNPETRTGIPCTDGLLMTFKHRLGSFRHKMSGIVFNMIPGSKKKSDDICERCAAERLVRDQPLDHFERLADFGPCNCKKVVKPFLMARYPVTNRQHHKLAQNSGLPLLTNQERGLPRVDTPWREVFNLVKYHGMTLPKDSQWIYACRTDTSTKFYWGDDFDGRHCWHVFNSEYSMEQVNLRYAGYGSFRRHFGPHIHSSKEHDGWQELEHGLMVKRGRCFYNSFGLVDMLGNVWEWMDTERTLGWSYKVQPTLDPYDSSYPIGEDGDMSDIGYRPIIELTGV